MIILVFITGKLAFLGDWFDFDSWNLAAPTPIFVGTYRLSAARPAIGSKYLAIIFAKNNCTGR